MDRPCGNVNFVPNFGMANLAIDLKLQLTFKNKNELVCAMDEILPTLPRWINP